MTRFNSQYHIELMAMFEKVFRGEGRFDRETKDLWPRGRIYQDGRVNQLFLAYRHGAAFRHCDGKAMIPLNRLATDQKTVAERKWSAL